MDLGNRHVRVLPALLNIHFVRTMLFLENKFFFRLVRFDIKTFENYSTNVSSPDGLQARTHKRETPMPESEPRLKLAHQQRLRLHLFCGNTYLCVYV